MSCSSRTSAIAFPLLGLGTGKHSPGPGGARRLRQLTRHTIAMPERDPASEV